MVLMVAIFIVIYVLNKIYICIFDNQPFPPPPQPWPALNHRNFNSRYVWNDAELAFKVRPKNARSIATQTRLSTIYRGSTPVYQASNAMRITLTLRPCYLISIQLDACNNDYGHHANSFMGNCKWRIKKFIFGHSSDVRQSSERVLKYYDDLASVPSRKLLMRSVNRFDNVRQVLKDVRNIMTKRR